MKGMTMAVSATPGDDTDTDPTTQSNTNTTQQFALAYNLDSSDDVTTAQYRPIQPDRYTTTRHGAGHHPEQQQ